MKKIKLTTLILIIILISLISFGGLYLKTDYKFQNVLPEYKLGRNLSESRIIEIIPSQEVNKVIKDAEGNIVAEAGENTVTEEVPVNSQELLNKENFVKTKEIVIKRLEQMGVTDYNISLNEENGKIILKLENSETTDVMSTFSSQKGKFEIIDEETDEVLINGNDIKLVEPVYGSDEKGTVIYLNIIKLNKSGEEKLEKIKQELNGEENSTNKNVVLKVDGETISTSEMKSTMASENIKLKVGESSTNNETLQRYLSNASYMAMLINIGEMPITYKTESDQYISSNIQVKDIMPYAIYSLVAITISIFVVMAIRYKGLGILGTLSVIGFVAALLIVLRYTNVVITLEGIIGIIFSIVLDLLLVKLILKDFKNNKNTKEAIKGNYKKYFAYITTPVAIMAITFSFINVAGIASLGMTMFWGLALIALYNIVITRAMFTIVQK